jgi:hypothetical protein
MSRFRVEKHRAPAEITLVAGAVLAGDFFLSRSSQVRSGPERVGDVLNESGFFPFESAGQTSLINRAHVIKVALPLQKVEAQLDADYDVATRRHVSVLLTTGEAIVGDVIVFRPAGHDRLSDYAHLDQRFRYVEAADRSLLINSAHIVMLTEVAQS